MKYTGTSSSTKCVICGKEIATTRQFITDAGFEYKTENKDCRYIDKWGFARNFCKDCIK